MRSNFAELNYLDCQITGTPEMLSERRGVIFVSGNSQAAARCDDLFSAAVERHLFIGEFGLATRLKTANNLLVAVHTTVAAEALALAVNAEIDPNIAIEVMSNGAGQSRMFVQRAPMMARREYPGTSGALSWFMICCDLIEKRIARTNAHSPLAEAAIKLHREALAPKGNGDLDNACVYELVGALRSLSHRWKRAMRGVLGFIGVGKRWAVRPPRIFLSRHLFAPT